MLLGLSRRGSGGSLCEKKGRRERGGFSMKANTGAKEEHTLPPWNGQEKSISSIFSCSWDKEKGEVGLKRSRGTCSNRWIWEESD